MFDPSKLHEVKSRFERKTKSFDIIFNSETSVFRFSDKFFNDHRLSVNGLKFSLSENQEVILSIQPDQDSTFYKKKVGSENKTKSFKHELLTKELVSRGVVSGELSIDNLGTFSGVEYLRINTNPSSSLSGETPAEQQAIEEDVVEEEALAEESSAEAFEDELL